MIHLWHLTPMAQKAWAYEADVVRRYDRIARDYDSHYRGTREIAEDLAIGRWMLESGVLPGPARTLELRHPLVVDVGCGTGLTLDIAAAVGHPILPEHYLGVDPSRGMLAVAQERWPDHRFSRSYAELLEHETGRGRASAVVGLFGPYNYAQPDLAFPEAARVLAPGGTLFLVCYSSARQDFPDYICGMEHLPPLWTAAGLRARLEDLEYPWWTDVRVWGFSARWWYRLGARWRGSARALAQLARLDSATLGSWRPDARRYLVATAVRTEVAL